MYGVTFMYSITLDLLPNTSPGISQEALSGLSKHEIVKLLESTILVIVHNDLIVHALHLAELELSLRLRKTLADRLLGLGAAALQAHGEVFKGWWCDEDVARVEAGGLDLLDTLICVSITLSIKAMRRIDCPC